MRKHSASCVSTEGWVAGVKLALLAAAEPREGIGDFNGAHFEVARYLGTSVLQEQTPSCETSCSPAASSTA